VVLVALVTSFATVVATGAIRHSRARRARVERDSIAHDTTILRAGVVQGAVRRAVVPAGREQATPPDELRRRVDNLKPGSYIDDIIAEQDSALYRWHERLSDALRVYVEPTSTIAGFDPAYTDLARTAFAEWSEAGFPIRFTFIYDSTSADIKIHWKERFPPDQGQRIGVTERIQTSSFWIAAANVDIANHDSTGRQLSNRTVAGILRHEIGHALGLNHASDPSSVMYRESASTMIGPSDRATLRLLYLIPPGSLR
jgi:predicted Zn-dependent protease